MQTESESNSGSLHSGSDSESDFKFLSTTVNCAGPRAGPSPGLAGDV
jgi:hypothetical protein